MQLVAQFDAVDELKQIHTVSVYQQPSGKQLYRLNDRDPLDPLDERWFVTMSGDVLERVDRKAPPAAQVDDAPVT